MKKNDEIELLIEDMGADGSGVGRVDGMAFFVKDALVGDRVRAKIVKLKKTYGFARLLEVTQPSAYRVEPRCPLHRKCGGCQLQALSYEKQLEYKERKVRENLERIGGLDLDGVTIEPAIGMAEPYRYRNKAQFPVGADKDGNAAAGFYAARTHSMVPVDDCCLGVVQNKEVMRRVLSWMRQYGIAPYDERTGSGLVRHVLIRYAFRTKQLMVCLVLNGKKLPQADALIRGLAEIAGIANISISINQQQNNVIMGDTSQTLWGQDYIEDWIGDIKFQISPLSFYQVNPIQTEALYGKVLEYAQLSGTEVVWDLYCGIGTISLFMAQRAKQVYGVEVVPQAVADAKRNAALNHIANVEFFEGRAEEILPSYYESNHPDDAQHPQVIVVDPPRKGCQQSLLDTIVRVQPQRVVYVSCDPATLARDLKYLCGHGLEVRNVQAVDVFCQTVHVETIVLLSHKSPDSV